MKDCISSLEHKEYRYSIRIYRPYRINRLNFSYWYYPASGRMFYSYYIRNRLTQKELKKKKALKIICMYLYINLGIV